MFALSAENRFQEETLLIKEKYLYICLRCGKKSIFNTISGVRECDEICPDFTMHYPFLLCLVCALSNAQLSEQNPVK